MTIRRFEDYIIKYDSVKEGDTVYFTCTSVSARLQPRSYLRVLREHRAGRKEPTLESMVDADRNPSAYLSILLQGIKIVRKEGPLVQEHRIAKKTATGIELINSESINDSSRCSDHYPEKFNPAEAIANLISNYEKIKAIQQVQMAQIKRDCAKPMDDDDISVCCPV